jgi:hypothetical protein
MRQPSKSQQVLPELFRLTLVFSEYQFHGLKLKNVILDLHKPDAKVEDLPKYPLRWMVSDYTERLDGRDDPFFIEDRGEPLTFIARQCFSQNEVEALERLITENPIEHLTLKKYPVKWPIKKETVSCDFGGYGPTTLSLAVTKTIEAYAYTAWDFAEGRDNEFATDFIILPRL